MKAPVVRLKRKGDKITVHEPDMRIVDSCHLPHAKDLLWGRKTMGTIVMKHGVQEFIPEDGVEVKWL